MLNPDDIKILENWAVFGDDANNLLKIYNDLLERTEKLDELLNNDKPITLVNFLSYEKSGENNSNKYCSIPKIKDTQFASIMIKQIISHELKLSKHEIHNLSLPDKFIE